MSSTDNNKIEKQSALELLNLQSLDDLNLGLIELAEALRKQGQEVSQELLNPEAETHVSREVLKMYRDFVKQALRQPDSDLIQSNLNQPKVLGTAQLSQPENTNPATNRESSEIAVTQFSHQVLSGVRDTLLQLHGVSAHMDGIEIADTVWETMIDAIVSRTEQRFNQLANSLSSDIQEKFNRLQARSQSKPLLQTQKLGELNTQAQSFSSQAQSLMQQTLSLPL